MEDPIYPGRWERWVPCHLMSMAGGPVTALPEVEVDWTKGSIDERLVH